MSQKSVHVHVYSITLFYLDLFIWRLNTSVCIIIKIGRKNKRFESNKVVTGYGYKEVDRAFLQFATNSLRR